MKSGELPKPEHILICRTHTTSEEIEAFMWRCYQSQGMPYFMLFPENLTPTVLQETMELIHFYMLNNNENQTHKSKFAFVDKFNFGECNIYTYMRVFVSVLWVECVANLKKKHIQTNL